MFGKAGDDAPGALPATDPLAHVWKEVLRCLTETLATTKLSRPETHP